MDPGGEFGFQNLTKHSFLSIENDDVKANLTKWSMADGIKLQAYSFDKPFRKYNETDFILDFFGCSNVISTLLKAVPGHKFAPIGVPSETVKFSEVSCTLTTLHLFDKLKEGNKIVRSNGSIVKCLPHYIRGEVNGTEPTFEMEIADNLRKFVLSDAIEDDYDDDWEDTIHTLSVSERKEFLFILFSHFVIGGSLCQYEDNMEPYIEATKLIYKDLIAVARAQEEAGDSDKLKVTSYVYKIHTLCNDSAVAGNKNLLFHRQYLNNFFYLVVNPLKQLCFTIYHHV